MTSDFLAFLCSTPRPCAESLHTALARRPGPPAPCHRPRGRALAGGAARRRGEGAALPASASGQPCASGSGAGRGVGPGGSSSGRPPRVPQAPPPQQDGDPQGCGCAPRSLGHASSSEGRTPAAGRLHPIRRSPGPSDQLSIVHTVHPAPRPGPQRPVSHTHASSLQLHFIRCNILSTGPTPPHLLRLWAQRW